MAAVVEEIYISPDHGQAQCTVSSAVLSSETGLEGDRYANTDPAVVTLIAAEEVEAFTSTTGLSITPGETGRNIVTRGVDLNPLVGRQFSIGDVLMQGMELCEPCATLGQRLSTAEVTPAQVVKTFTHTCGIRAYVRSSGAIEPGAAVG